LSNSNFSVRQLIEASACTGCRLCVDVCPAVSAAGDGRLSGLYRLTGLRRIAGSRAGLLARLMRRGPIGADDMTRFGETVFKCTLCANCEEVCPVGLHLRDLWYSVRQDVVGAGAGPRKVEAIRENLEETYNVFGEDNEERADWVEDLPDAPEDGYVRDRADVVYFTGCVAAYYPLAQQIPMAMAEIMEARGVNFTLLGEDEWCCGFPLLGAGLKDQVRTFIDHNIEAVRKRGAQKIVFACPSCYHIWREMYPPEFEIFHFTGFMEDLLAQEPFPLGPLDLKVTYHDPCDLGRGARVFEAPRRVIRSIPGVNLVEMPRNRENCLCCGGGGNLEMTDPELSAGITRLKIEEVLGTGARAVVTACQQCVRTMTTYVRRNDVPLEIMDMTQLIHKALKKS